MITDFSEYTSAGLRNITFNGVNSLTDLGILITTDGTSTDNLIVKSSSESLPKRQGNIDSSRTDGELYFEARKLSYRFKVFGDDRADLKDKEASVYAWLSSGGSFTIQDSDIDGYEYANCELKSISREDNEYGLEYSFIKAEFECDPFMKKSGTGKERIFKFTANTNASISITNGQNQSYTITVGEDTTTGTFTAADPQKYRLIAYTENAATITLNDAALATDTIFTMPASATIAITHTGLGYYELWHDTEEVRL